MPAARPQARARDDLERARDRAFRRVPARRVRSERDALAFVNEVGICSTFYRFPEGLACLWEAVVGRRDPRWPRRSHHDAGVGLTWELKDRLPARRDRLLRQAPQGPSRAGRPRPLSRLLRPGPRPAARPRLPAGVRGGPALARRQAPHGRPDPPAPPVHARVARGGAHAGSGLDPRLRARGGGAPAGALRREDGGALRPVVLVSLGPRGGLAPRRRPRGPAARRARRPCAGWSAGTWTAPPGAR